jgi:hypothetical protein
MGAHQPDTPYYILGANEGLPAGVAALKSRLASQGWRVDRDPAAGGGVTFVRIDDPGTQLSFRSFPSHARYKMDAYSVSSERLRDWEGRYANVYILEMFFP